MRALKTIEDLRGRRQEKSRLALGRLDEDRAIRPLADPEEGDVVLPSYIRRVWSYHGRPGTRSLKFELSTLLSKAPGVHRVQPVRRSSANATNGLN